MNYGIPYMGSKSKICEEVCRLFPKADHFYDLFGGGFSVTHFMLKHRSSHYKNFHFNELRPGICELVQDAIAGKYNYNVYKPEWISRDRFERDKEKDPMIKIIWSFGNNGKNYLFGKDIEQDKKSMHMAVVFNEFDDYAKEVFGMDQFKDGFDINSKRLFLKNRIRLLGKKRLDLQQLQQLEFYNTSYENVSIKENSVIYCDIPYGGTSEYDNSSLSFNRNKFFEWANDQKEPVFISEYNIEDARFKLIANFKKRSLLSSNKDNHLVKTEKIYVNHSAYHHIFKGRK
jgi:hypothetical protein